MNKSTKIAKLTLSKETLRSLTAGELTRVAGGSLNTITSDGGCIGPGDPPYSAYCGSGGGGGKYME